MTQTTPCRSAIDTQASPPSIRPRHTLAADGIAVAGYGLLTLLFFWPLFFEPGTYVPRGGGDLASFLFPVYSFAARSLQAGTLPLWNPYLYAGSPFAADMQTGLFYPLNLIAFFTARPFTYQVMEGLAIVHYFLAGVFAYTYLRVLRLSPLPAFAGGAAFGFSGFLVAHLGHLNMVEAAVWLPLILAAFHVSLRNRSILWAAIAGLLFGISILPGHVQIALYTGFFLILYWGWAVMVRTRGDGPETGGWGPSGGQAGVAIESSAAATRRGTPSPPPSPTGEREGPHPPPLSGAERGKDARVPASPPPASGAGAGGRGPSLVLLATTFFVAAGVAAIQIVPSFELTRLSVRSDITFAKALEFAASPRGLITWLAPHFFGGDAARYWGLTWSLTEVYAYVGVTTLAVAGLALIGRRRGWGWTGFFALAVIAFGLLSVAEQTPLYGWLYRFVPGFDKVRAAGRFSLFVDLALAVLAGQGVQVLIRPVDWRSRPVFGRYLRGLGWLGLALIPLAGVIYYAMLTSQDKDPVIFQRTVLASDSVTLGLALFWVSIALLTVQRYRRPPGIVLPAIVTGLIIVDLFGANMRFNPTDQNVVSNYQRDDAVAYLRQAPGAPFRIDTETGIGEVWPPDASLLFGLEDVMGIFNPMQLADHQRYWAGLGSRSTAAYDLLGARYLIAKPDAPLDTAKFRPVQGAGPLVIYENARALPPAFLVPVAEVVPREAIVDRLKAPELNPRSTVLLEQPLPLPPGEPTGGDVAAIDRPSPNQLVVRTAGPGPAYLFVSEVFYPGWQATVDGQPAEIRRANYLFRALALPAGSHEVRFSFRPATFTIGAAISGLTLIVLIALGLWSLLGRRVRAETWAAPARRGRSSPRKDPIPARISSP